MSRPSRIAKRLLLPVLLAATFVGVQVVVASPPTASFTTSAQQPGSCGTFTFTDTSSDTESDIQSLLWNFGDGTTAPGTPGEAVSHPYTSAGPKTVTLTATDADTDPDAEGPLPSDGVETSAPPASATVTVVNGAPTATATPPTDPQLGQQVNVQGAEGTPADPDGIASYGWDTDGDGQYDDGQLAQLTIDYATAQATPGLKTVALQIVDGCGVPSARTPVSFFVTNPPPKASFTVGSSSIQAGDNVTITSTSTDQLGGSIAHYQWDLNNNQQYNEGGATGEIDAAAVTTSFASSPATIRLIVTDNHGATDDEVGFVAISALPFPTADLDYSPANPLPGQAVTFTSKSSPAQTAGAPALDRTEWDFNYAPGDFSVDAVGGAATTSFATPGPKTVAIRANDVAGGSAVASATVVVNAPPQAAFTVSPAKPVEGREVTFASTSNDPDGPLVKQEWDLNNDGKYERSGAVASTSSLKKGTRTVRLRVTDSKGAMATSALPVKVGAMPLKNPRAYSAPPSTARGRGASC